MNSGVLPMAAKQRTTLRSRSGKKLYANRDAQGRFEDIQSTSALEDQTLNASRKLKRPHGSAPGRHRERSRSKDLSSGRICSGQIDRAGVALKRGAHSKTSFWPCVQSSSLWAL